MVETGREAPRPVPPLRGFNLRGRVESSTRKSEDRQGTWRRNVIQVNALHDRTSPSDGQVDPAYACPIACHCQRQSHPGCPAFGGDVRGEALDMGQHDYEYHWYEHPGIGRVELKRKRVHEV